MKPNAFKLYCQCFFFCKCRYGFNLFYTHKVRGSQAEAGNMELQSVIARAMLIDVIQLIDDISFCNCTVFYVVKYSFKIYTFILLSFDSFIQLAS